MFRPEYNNKFMCPTCFNVLSIEEVKRISEAHIVPKSAGGKLKTFLCKDCNSRFGSKQDKWFGEIIKLTNDNEINIFATAIKDGYFLVDGIKVNGHWEQRQDGGFNFFNHIDRNPPYVNQLIKDKFNNKPPNIELSITFPILRNKKLIEIGYLTAAYLMWFGLFGYSWALQDHLDQIRNQILNPEKEIINSKYLFTVEPADWKPWIGLVSIFGDTIPAFGLKKHMVVLPPRNKPNYYNSLTKVKTSIKLTDIKPFKLFDKPFYGPPVAILYEDQLIVFAKTSKEATNLLQVILFTPDSDEGRVLTPIDKQTFNELEKLKSSRIVHIDVKPD